MMKVLHIIFWILLLIYIIGNLFNKDLLILLDFNSSSGIFWVFVGLFLLNFMPIIKSIIREIAQNKVSEYSSDEIMEQFQAKILNDKNLMKILKEKIDNPKVEPIENYKGDKFLSTTGEPDKSWVNFIKQFLP